LRRRLGQVLLARGAASTVKVTHAKPTVIWL
jgi:hypothetical protein